MRVMALASAAILLLAAAGGPYTGTWESSRSDAAGTIRIRLKPEPEVVFTLSDREIKTKIISSKVTETGFDIAYDFTLEGYEVRSGVKGTFVPGGVRGEYRTTAGGDGSEVDAGTFRAEAAAN